MLTRKRARDVVDIELAFSPKDALPRDQLPTKSDVIERALNETNWRTRLTKFWILLIIPPLKYAIL